MFGNHCSPEEDPTRCADRGGSIISAKIIHQTFCHQIVSKKSPQITGLVLANTASRHGELIALVCGEEKRVWQLIVGVC